ncbi:MAG: MMPL family transporter [Gemmatimonas sp.]
MTRLAAILWLLIVVAAGAYLAARVHEGLRFRTDILALLPREERDPAMQSANDAVGDALARHVVLLVGHPDRDSARAGASSIAAALEGSGAVELGASRFSGDRLRQLGERYFPHRGGLLSEDDRRRLLDGKADEIASRALAQVYGVVGMADARLLRADPYLLMPAFLAALPLPMSRLTLDDGMLTVRADGTTWILLAGRVLGDPYNLDVQERVTHALDTAMTAADAAHPGIGLLRLGAVFYARAGGEQALHESSMIGIASVIGSVVLVLAVFRSLTPLWLNLLAVAVGVVVTSAVCLLVFGELHVAALLFGVSLIGIAIDYGLQYCAELFAPDYAPPRERLRRVLTGITVGVLSVTIGYLTLLAAPFPGLHQIGAFAAVGLLASWTTVVLWLPALDRSQRPTHGAALLAAASRALSFWREPRRRPLRLSVFAAIAVAGGLGLLRVHADDDVRHMQSLSPTLVAEQDRLQALTGIGATSQFFLIRAADEETALEREEALSERLRPLVREGALQGFQSPAQFVPSAARQRDNRALVRDRLFGDTFADYLRRLNLDAPPIAPDADAAPLRLADVLDANGPLGFLSSLVLDTGNGATHVVILDGVKRRDAVASAADGLDDVRFVDPAGQFSALIGKYRVRGVMLLAASAALMAPLLLWRYGLRGGALVMVPTLVAVMLAPAARALFGAPFTFFDAMALVLVLSIGIDYAVFLAETDATRAPVTLLAVALAAATTLMSFGLLSLSSASAVHAFGTTMLIGVLTAVALAPLATGVGKARRRS